MLQGFKYCGMVPQQWIGVKFSTVWNLILMLRYGTDSSNFHFSSRLYHLHQPRPHWFVLSSLSQAHLLGSFPSIWSRLSLRTFLYSQPDCLVLTTVVSVDDLHVRCFGLNGTTWNLPILALPQLQGLPLHGNQSLEISVN